MNSNPTAVLIDSLYKPVRILAIMLLSIVFIQAYLMFRYSRKVKNSNTAKELRNLSYSSLGVVIGMAYLMYRA